MIQDELNLKTNMSDLTMSAVSARRRVLTFGNQHDVVQTLDY